MSSQTKAYIYALLSVLLWSTVATAFKIALSAYAPFQFLFLASVVSFVCFGLILVFNKRFLKTLQKQTTKQIWHSAVQGFFNPFFYYVVLFTAYSRLPAQIAQPLNYTWPLVLVILSAPLLKQPLRVYSIIALLISFSGVVVISLQGRHSPASIPDITGVMLAAGSSVIWALYWIISKRDQREEVEKLFLSFFFGMVYTGILVLYTGNFTTLLNIKILAVVYTGLFEMGITFYFWLKAMQLTPRSDKISNLVYLSPFISLVFIHFILGENIYFTTLGGLLLIVSGIFFQQIVEKRKKAE